MIDRKTINWLKSIVGRIDEDDQAALGAVQEHFRFFETVEISKKIFDSVHSKSKQRLLGISYTPAEVREELTKVVLENFSEPRRIKTVRILDPCCGSGTFSITLLKRLSDLGLDLKDAFQNNVYFSDFDKISVAISLINVKCYLERHGIDACNLTPNAKVIDFFQIEEEFDGFITNPPYVKLQNLGLEVRSDLRRRYPQLFTGALGLSALFMAKMFDDLSEDGMAGVITQNNFFTSLAGKPLREFFQRNVFKIDTFGSEALFEDVSAYTCLLYLKREQQNTFEYRKIDSLNGFATPAELVNNSSLFTSTWKLGSQPELELIKKVESKGSPLGSITRIWVGIATQLDKAFTVEKIGNQWYGDFEGEKFGIEKGVVRHLVKISDFVDQASLVGNKRGIIYPYVFKGNKPVPMIESDLIEKYPKCHNYLLHWKAALLNRQKGNIPPEDWYKWGRIQSMIPVRGKLLTKTFDRSPNFLFDESDSLFSNGYALIPTSDSFDILYIQAVLQSRIFANYMSLTSFEIKGGFHCYQKNFIERFCVPTINIELQRELVACGNIDDFLREYFELD